MLACQYVCSHETFLACADKHCHWTQRTRSATALRSARAQEGVYHGVERFGGPWTLAHIWPNIGPWPWPWTFPHPTPLDPIIIWDPAIYIYIYTYFHTPPTRGGVKLFCKEYSVPIHDGQEESESGQPAGRLPPSPPS